MKVEARVLDVDSTLEGEKVGMTIDQGALAHIMSVLTDLYSDPEMAVIREYSTNAFDAHVEGKVARPVEVQTPSSLSPFFKVRDYGEGLDAEDIREIYSRYGASTKRESNDVVGMLGLGCKSALTYTDQFTIQGIKNGICTQVSVSRDEDGSGSMTIVAEYKTDDPSGVEIMIPVQRRHNFADKCAHFFRFWKQGTVLVDGKEPKPIEGTWLTDNILVTRKDISQDYVVMGNVPYPMSGQADTSYGREAYYSGYDNKFYTIAFVNIGDVNFTPSREALQMNVKTKATIQNIREIVKVEQQKAFQREIDNAPTKPEALDKYFEVIAMGFKPEDDAKYKGQVIPLHYKYKSPVKAQGAVKDDKGTVIIPAVKDDPGEQYPVFMHSQKPWGHRGWQREDTLGATVIRGKTAYGHGNESVGFFINYDGSDPSPTKRKKLEQWATDKQISLPKQLVLVDKIPSVFNDWIKAEIYDWNEVAAIKLVYARTTRSDGRPTGAYDGYTESGWKTVIKADEIDTTKPIYYWNQTVENDRGRQIVQEANPKGYTAIKLTSNRMAKFQRDFPQAKRLWPEAIELAQKWEKNLTQDQLLNLSFANDSYNKKVTILMVLDETEINDPELANLIVQAKAKTDATLKKAYNVYSAALDLDPRVDDPFKAYPLLTVVDFYGTLNTKVKEEMTLYFNAAYKARKDGN